MESVEAARIVGALEIFAQSGRGDVKALKGPLKGQHRLSVGKWRVFFRFDHPDTVVVIDVDNRAQAY